MVPQRPGAGFADSPVTRNRPRHRPSVESAGVRHGAVCFRSRAAASQVRGGNHLRSTGRFQRGRRHHIRVKIGNLRFAGSSTPIGSMSRWLVPLAAIVIDHGMADCASIADHRRAKSPIGTSSGFIHMALTPSNSPYGSAAAVDINHFDHVFIQRPQAGLYWSSVLEATSTSGLRLVAPVSRRRGIRLRISGSCCRNTASRNRSVLSGCERHVRRERDRLKRGPTNGFGTSSPIRESSPGRPQHQGIQHVAVGVGLRPGWVSQRPHQGAHDAGNLGARK